MDGPNIQDQKFLLTLIWKIESENLFWLMQKLNLNDLDFFRYKDYVAKQTVE